MHVPTPRGHAAQYLIFNVFVYFLLRITLHVLLATTRILKNGLHILKLILTWGHIVFLLFFSIKYCNSHCACSDFEGVRTKFSSCKSTSDGPPRWRVHGSTAQARVYYEEA